MNKSKDLEIGRTQANQKSTDSIADTRNPKIVRTSIIESLLTTLSTDSELEIREHSQFGKYQDLKILGCHGQATVALASDPQLERQVVLKIYHPTIGGFHRDRILREGRALVSITDPRIVSCYSIEEIDNRIFLVMEFIDGVTLTDYVDEAQPDWERILELIIEISMGVRAVHQTGLIHGDLKPSNIMVASNGDIKLIDFGLVKSDQDSASDAFSGTPAYMAPECANGMVQEIDQLSDVFSIGSILYELLTGYPPFAANSSVESRRLSKKGIVPPIPNLEQGEIYSSLADVCSKCLEKERENRLANIDLLVDELLEIQSRQSAKSNSIKKNLTLVLSVTAILGFLGWMSAVIFWNENKPVAYDFYPAIEKLSQLRTKIPATIAEHDLEKSMLLVNEGIELASHSELENIYLKEVKAVLDDLEDWTRANEPLREQVAGGLRTIFGNSGGANPGFANPITAENLEEILNDLNAIEQLFGEDSPLTIESKLRFTLASASFPQQCNQISGENLQNCIAVFGDTARITQACRYERAKFLFTQGLREEAIKLLKTVVSFVKDDSGPSRRLALQALHQIILQYALSPSSLQKGVDHLTTADELMDSIPVNHTSRMALLDRVSHAYAQSHVLRQQKKSQELVDTVQPTLDELKKVPEKTKGPNIRLLEAALNSSLLGAYSELEDLEGIKNSAKFALDAIQSIQGKNSFNYQVVSNQAGLSLSKLEPLLATKYFQEAQQVAKEINFPYGNVASGYHAAKYHPDASQQLSLLNSARAELGTSSIDPIQVASIYQYDAEIAMDIKLLDDVKLNLEKSGKLIYEHLGKLEKDSETRPEWEVLRDEREILLQRFASLKSDDSE